MMHGQINIKPLLLTNFGALLPCIPNHTLIYAPTRVGVFLTPWR